MTRTYTHPDVLTVGVEQGWADPEVDPSRIDWPARQRVAAIPFEVVDNRPVNPCEKTGVRYGRGGLGHWGEALAADALVSATDRDGHRWIVMVEREDGHGWALPGGHVQPGEAPVAAAGRELTEETGLLLEDVVWRVMPPRYVPDPRATDEAWMVTVLARTHLGTHDRDRFPTLVAGDDARRAVWVRADSYQVLTRDVTERLAGEVFAAHRGMLADVLKDFASAADSLRDIADKFDLLTGATPPFYITVSLCAGLLEREHERSRPVVDAIAAMLGKPAAPRKHDLRSYEVRADFGPVELGAYAMIPREDPEKARLRAEVERLRSRLADVTPAKSPVR